MKYPQLVSMPSAVSDWLEEQLEARGIDAVVYTRYVLSLLHRDHRVAEQEFLVENDLHLNKNGTGTGNNSRKRFRRTTADWWRYVRRTRTTDPDQLRRSAAVECLMSAAEQKCGIESLVDELCEKLKHFESTSSTDQPQSPNKSPSKSNSSAIETNNPSACCLSPSDLARRYYAAFPPLTAGGNPRLISSLLPSWYTSAPSGTVHKRAKRRPTEAMKSRSGGKTSRSFAFGTARHNAKKDFGFVRSMEESNDVLSDWDMYVVQTQRQRITAGGDEGYSTSDTTGGDDDAGKMRAKMGGGGGGGSGTNNNNHVVEDSHLADLVAKFDRRIEALWNTEECIDQNNENEYHDLPVDIQELLASPTKEEESTTIEFLNVANKRADRVKPFIQCGTNITSSIWSECADEDKSLYDSISYCNLYNEALETDNNSLGDQFNSLTVGSNKKKISMDDDDLFAMNKENETNMLYENINSFTSLPWEISFPKWSDAENYNYLDDANMPSFKRSLMTLNHNKEASCFKEVVPKHNNTTTVRHNTELLPPPCTVAQEELSKEEKEKENNNNQSSSQPDNSVPDQLNTSVVKEDEDLLTSTRTHFRPIKQEQAESASNNNSGSGGRYADGTTFAIRSSLEHVNYRRSASGTLYLESGFDTPKKYMEYRQDDNNKKEDDEETTCYSIEREFVLKFCVKQNEKYCQTELPLENNAAGGESMMTTTTVQSHSPLEVPAKKRVLCDPDEFFFPGDEELLSDTVGNNTSTASIASSSCECNCNRSRAKLATNLEPLFNASSETCSLHGNRPDSMQAEVGWKDGNWKKCDKCNNNWSTGWGKNSKPGGDATNTWDSWQHIWSSSEELCLTCASGPAGSGPRPNRNREYFKLREELSEDGEQLLSDLSCLQRVYMEQQLPQAEISCDRLSLNQLAAESAVAAAAATAAVAVAANVVTKERKRRHSSSLRPNVAEISATIQVARNSWTNTAAAMSFCLRADERCTFTPPPLLRPVTL